MMPSQVGGSAPTDKHLSGAVQTLLKGQQAKEKQAGEHLSKAALQSQRQPRFLPQRQA
jgi:hypothetical protein